MKTYAIILISIILFSSSCVSKKKFVSEQKKVKNLQTDSIGTHSNLNDCNSKVANLENEKAGIQQAMQNLSSSSQTSIENSKMTIADQAKRLKDLQTLIHKKSSLTNLKKQLLMR